MRLVTYEYFGAVRAGVIVGEFVVDLQRTYSSLVASDGTTEQQAAAVVPPNLKALLEGGAASLNAARAVAARAEEGLVGHGPEWEVAGLAIPVHRVRLWPPITNPSKIICLGRNYRAHAEEAGGEVPKAPELFVKCNNTLIGHEWPIVLPAVSSEVDYEAELAVVVGRRACNVSEELALDYVAGYTVLNDVSARDYQFLTSQWLAGKSMDTFGPVGPWIVTSDEVTDPQVLQIRLDINGEVLQDANTSTMVFSVRASVAFISTVMTLEPGDIVSTGTPAGVGFTRTPPRYLLAGDTVTIAIDKIGTLRNPVLARRV